VYRDGTEILHYEWLAHRQLAETIHMVMRQQLQSLDLDWADIQGIVFYKGPGSFTGLRIGASVVNTLAHGSQIPIIGATSEKWISIGLDRLAATENDSLVVPEYGAPVRITKQKK
jgi:tRNA threonylcarbamoyladenosine biosynthesis protein TsaB